LSQLPRKPSKPRYLPIDGGLTTDGFKESSAGLRKMLSSVGSEFKVNFRNVRKYANQTVTAKSKPVFITEPNQEPQKPVRRNKAVFRSVKVKRETRDSSMSSKSPFLADRQQINVID
jgi:hypothetical protein